MHSKALHSARHFTAGHYLSVLLRLLLLKGHRNPVSSVGGVSNSLLQQWFSFDARHSLAHRMLSVSEAVKIEMHVTARSHLVYLHVIRWIRVFAEMLVQVSTEKAEEAAMHHMW